jgi:hypothetical protein
MHQFPGASELQFLIGLELNQIRLGQWNIQLYFESAQIFIEGDLEHVDKAGTVRRHNTDESRLSPLFLHHLFGQKIQMLEVEPFRLILAFDDGDILRIFSDEGPYESGQISDQNGLHTVF